MGLLSDIGFGIAKAINVGLETATVALAHPIKTIAAAISPTKTVAQVADEFFAQPVSKQLTQVAIGGASVAATTVGVGAVAKAASAGTLATSAAKLIPVTTKGKIIAAAAIPVTAGAVISNPVQTAKAVATTPQSLANVGANIGTLIKDPSIENVKSLVTENPVIVGGAVAAAALVGATKIIPAIATARQTEAIQEQTKAIEGATGLVVERGTTSDIVNIPAQNNAPIPQTPQTSQISPTTSTTRRKKSKSSKVIPQNISQKVNVIVSNDNRRATKNYIKERVLLN